MKGVNNYTQESSVTRPRPAAKLPARLAEAAQSGEVTVAGQAGQPAKAGKANKTGRRRLLLLALPLVLVVAVVLIWQFWPAGSGGLLLQESSNQADDSNGANSATDPDGNPDSGSLADAAVSATQLSDSSSQANEQDTAADKPQPLVVYITGAVSSPGVYSLPQDARLADVVAAAGGLRQDAASSYVNLAAYVQDAQHIHIPSQAEIDSGEASRIAALSEQAIGADSAGNSVSAASNSAATSSGTGSSQQLPALVNINTADSAGLQSLPGIGPATASKIIAYRDKYGPFVQIEDIQNVSGIGPAKYSALVGLICVA